MVTSLAYLVLSMFLLKVAVSGLFSLIVLSKTGYLSLIQSLASILYMILSSDVNMMYSQFSKPNVPKAFFISP